MRETRKSRAYKLLKTLRAGPSLRDGVHTPAEFASEYKIWSETWIIPAVLNLVPELREKSEVAS